MALGQTLMEPQIIISSCRHVKNCSKFRGTTFVKPAQMAAACAKHKHLFLLVPLIARTHNSVPAHTSPYLTGSLLQQLVQSKIKVPLALFKRHADVAAINKQVHLCCASEPW